MFFLEQASMFLRVALIVLLSTLFQLDQIVAEYGYGVDVYTLNTQRIYECLKKNGYDAALIRVYRSAGNGAVDTDAKSNIANALSAKLGVEVFADPAPSGSKDGAKQFDELYKYLKDSKITIQRIWLIVIIKFLRRISIQILDGKKYSF